jgi:hypothetical protein
MIAARVLTIALVALAASAVPEGNERRSLPAGAASMTALMFPQQATSGRPAGEENAKPATRARCACLHRLY